MIVGVPKEIMDHENRVGIDAGRRRGARQAARPPRPRRAGAGEGSGIADDEYASAGAEIVHGRRRGVLAEPNSSSR